MADDSIILLCVEDASIFRDAVEDLVGTFLSNVLLKFATNYEEGIAVLAANQDKMPKLIALTDMGYKGKGGIISCDAGIDFLMHANEDHPGIICVGMSLDASDYAKTYCERKGIPLIDKTEIKKKLIPELQAAIAKIRQPERPDPGQHAENQPQGMPKK